MNNVYLLPFGDRAYHAAIAPEPPSPDAIFLVEEGRYPVEVTYTRHDMNADMIWAGAECTDREDLTEFLNFLGECGHTIEILWNYNDRHFSTPELTELFNICYARKMEELTAAMEDLYELD